MLTIIMYHYVRDLRRCRFPRIKGLDLKAFRGQLDYIGQNYSVVTMEEVFWALEDGNDLPEDAALLTFDDGFSDHFTNVFPLLDKRGWQGSFFPASRPVLDHVVLDVHKIHFILASASSPEMLIRELRQEFQEYRTQWGLPSWDEYWHSCARANRFDPAEVIFLKRMLQVELPDAVRGAIVDSLFRRFVTHDEAAFAAELYMSVEQLRMMSRHGMYIGSHGHTHRWLDRLSYSDKVYEIEQSLALLRRVDPEMGSWAMCYPYGAHDQELRTILRDSGAVVGLTAEVATADVTRQNALMLPRLDTNDLPRAATVASPDSLTRAAG